MVPDAMVEGPPRGMKVNWSERHMTVGRSALPSTVCITVAVCASLPQLVADEILTVTDDTSATAVLLRAFLDEGPALPEVESVEAARFFLLCGSRERRKLLERRSMTFVTDAGGLDGGGVRPVPQAVQM